MASARGIPVRLVGALYMVALALAVGLSSLAIGTILSTALLVGPAATALRVTARMGSALMLSAAIGVAATWAGVLLAYDSYYWGTGGNGWPVSFFIVAAVFIAYLISGLPAVRAVTRRGRPGAAKRGGPGPVTGFGLPPFGATSAEEHTCSRPS
jgi:zinc/manganese transport system permease protein